MTVNEEKLEQLVGQFVADFGAAMHGATVVIGDKLGLYRALVEHGPITGADLAHRTGFDTRLVEEWLNAQFVSGYCEYDPATGQFSLTVEQAAGAGANRRSNWRWCSHWSPRFFCWTSPPLALRSPSGQ